MTDTLPCSGCGGPIPYRPGQLAHLAARFPGYENSYAHFCSSCVTPPVSSREADRREIRALPVREDPRDRTGRYSATA